MGLLGEIEEARLDQQLVLKNHNCAHLVQVYDGGRIEERLYVLMSRAPGVELERFLSDVPRSHIRTILDGVARACLFLRDHDLCHRDVKAANIFTTEDFGHATLLDISVVRAIHDPVGVGTDHDGQLPVLATARYCSPEYLFRLLEPGPELWHALTIYQLGALLHDLIARVPLFQPEYEASATNRYRFAWLVANRIPRLRASDVDADLLLLASRALDKDWQRRSSLQIEDFLLEPERRESQALYVLGLGQTTCARAARPLGALSKLAGQAATLLEEALTEYVRENGVTAVHRVTPGSHGDSSRTIHLEWDAPVGSCSATISFRLGLRLLETGSGRRFNVTAMLSRRVDGETKSVELYLPDVADDESREEALARQSVAALGKLAAQLVGADITDHERTN